jgi:Sulfotransferase family
MDRVAPREAEFDVESLLVEASAATGLSDFGDADFREPLGVLCQTYQRAAYDERGRKRNRRRVLQLLSSRLRVEAALRRHPEIREREIRRPMVLTGLPRSGTSALFNLLAADAEARPLLLWETQHPDPVEGLAPGQPDPRYLAIKTYYEEAHQKNPEFTKMHYASADTPEECVLLQALSLNGVHYGVEPMLEPYASWYRKQDLRPMYRYYRTLLQMLDWQRPGERWLLKAPAHMWAIDPLIETFPDVSVVWSHRDPLLCIASICSMTWAIPNGALQISKQELGPVVFDFYATSLERGLAVRDRSDEARFIDVTHDDFVDDSLGVARRIYAHFGLSLSKPAEAAMQAHVRENPQGKHGRHTYALEEWGLSADAVRERFKSYIERFDLGGGAT